MMQTNAEPDMLRKLDLDRPPGRNRKLKRAAVAAAMVSLPAAAALILGGNAGNAGSQHYATQQARQGTLSVTVTATGTLKAVNQVDVGSELSGIVKTVAVDYNDRVKAGQPLARLDTEILEARVAQSKASLESAGAKLVETTATVVEARDKLQRLKQVWEKSNGRVPSRNDLDAAEAALKRAEAAEAGAKAQVAEALATLESNRTNLAKTVIRSPINGVVLTRSVEPGQTVAASLQAPVLFTLAEDLTQMKLHVNVDEADVGRVREGQEATFAVDAYPNRVFPAKITQVRFGSKTVDGVVTYETVLRVDNTDLSLRPGMTATAEISVRKVENAVLVPSAALRFTPSPQQKRSASRGLIGSLLPRPPQPSSEPSGASAKEQQMVWTLRDGQPVAVQVSIGASDGAMTEVTSGQVKPGMELIVDTLEKAK